MLDGQVAIQKWSRCLNGLLYKLGDVTQIIGNKDGFST